MLLSSFSCLESPTLHSSLFFQDTLPSYPLPPHVPTSPPQPGPLTLLSKRCARWRILHCSTAEQICHRCMSSIAYHRSRTGSHVVISQDKCFLEVKRHTSTFPLPRFHFAKQRSLSKDAPFLNLLLELHLSLSKLKLSFSFRVFLNPLGLTRVPHSSKVIFLPLLTPQTVNYHYLDINTQNTCLANFSTFSERNMNMVIPCVWNINTRTSSRKRSFERVTEKK